MINKTVLCYLEKDDQYLLLERNKKKNDLNEGKFIGIGGHIEALETPEEALIREIKEETNYDLVSYTYKGKVTFINKNGLDIYQEIMYVYTSNCFKGIFSPCNEGTFHWVNKKDIYSLPLWEGDKYFLNKLDNEKEFELELVYDNNQFIECKEL